MIASPRSLGDASRAAANDTSRRYRGDTSSGADGDTSGEASGDASARSAGDTSPKYSRDACAWCGEPTSDVRNAKYCSHRHRQAAYRTRRITQLERAGEPRRLAVFDPPYLGKSKRYYAGEASYAGEVDHAELLGSTSDYDGWALCCSADSLRVLLPMCPPDIRIASWGIQKPSCEKTRGPHGSWEPVIYKPARLRRPGFCDWLTCQPARRGGTLTGRKPLAFVAWVLRLLGAAPGDSLFDRYPGTGIFGSVGRELGMVTL